VRPCANASSLLRGGGVHPGADTTALGRTLSAGVLVLLTLSVRPLRTNCWIVGTGWYLFP